MDTRKHPSQMTNDEARHVERRIRPLANTWQSIGHASDRMRSKGVSPSDVSEALFYGELIEVHPNAAPDIRALVRNGAVCVVVSLTSKQVVTVWRCALDDNHKTLDKGLYTWNANLTEVIR